jgi:hypothetical protein
MTSKSVGYGKPPKSGQFAKGRSGNPKGRAKGTRNFTTVVGEVMREKVMITKRGKRRSITAMEAVLQRLMMSALQGDAKATAMVVNLALQMSRDAAGSGQPVPTAAQDAQIVQRALERLSRKDEKSGRLS